MIYSSVGFIAALPFVLIGFYALRRPSAQNLFLLATSIAFLATFGWIHVVVAATVVAFGYIVLRWAQMYPSCPVLPFAIFALIANLTLFKLLPVISGNISTTTYMFADNWIVPIGLSFYTFQIVGGLIEFSVEKQPVQPLAFFNFITFFPHLIAGPICRVRNLYPQFASAKRPSAHNLMIGISLFILGYFKKVLIADPLSNMIGPIWANPIDHSALDLLMAALGFYVQIFADFSGYTDMGRGVARMFGFRLPINFCAPYLAESPLDFWRRWHISLTNWFRRYYFQPLALLLSRRVRSQTRREIGLTCLVVVVLSSIGLWHGIALRFALFGVIHASLVILWQMATRGRQTSTLFARSISWSIFQVSLLGSLIVFRAPNFSELACMLHGLVVWQPGIHTTSAPVILLNLAVIFLIQIVDYSVKRRSVAAMIIRGRRSPIFVSVVLLLFALVFAYTAIEPDRLIVGNEYSGKPNRFIYMDF